jgi:hypothetical protein
VEDDCRSRRLTGSGCNKEQPHRQHHRYQGKIEELPPQAVLTRSAFHDIRHAVPLEKSASRLKPVY